MFTKSAKKRKWLRLFFILLEKGEIAFFRGFRCLENRAKYKQKSPKRKQKLPQKAAEKAKRNIISVISQNFPIQTYAIPAKLHGKAHTGGYGIAPYRLLGLLD